MATILIDFPGVQVVDQSQPVTRSLPFNCCYMLGSANIGTSKQLVKVTDYADFITKFGTDCPSKHYVKAFFDNASATVNFYYYKVNSGNTPAVHNDYINAVDSLDPTQHLSGIIIAPEYYNNAAFTSANRLAFNNKLNDFCDIDKGGYWISYVDTLPTHDTANLIITEKNAAIISPKGNLVTYAPSYKTNDAGNPIVLPSAPMAAISLSLWNDGKYYQAPAGNVAIKNVKELLWTPIKSDLATFHSEGINAIRYFSYSSSYIPYDSRTVSNAPEFYQLNSVVCYKVVSYMLYGAVFPLVHSALYGGAEALTTIEATINKTLYDAYTSGYLVGRNATEAFDVKREVEQLPDPNNALVSYVCSIRPSYSIQKIVLYLQNVLTQSML